jgi:hypothetical protein
MRSNRFWLIAVALAGVALGGCGDDDSGGMKDGIAFGPEGNRLHAYSTSGPLEAQVLIASADDDPQDGRDINGQVCFLPGTRRFIAGEDTGQPNPPPAWGVFELDGRRVGELAATQVGRLVTTFQGPPGEEGVPDTADPYGCGFLSDGRLVTTDIGNTATGSGNGQLVIWFPPFDQGDVEYCKLDVAITTAQGVFVDANDDVYVASARGSGSAVAGIYRFRGPFPTSADAAGGCGDRDGTGAPLAVAVDRQLFLADAANVPTPNGVVGTAAGTFYVSSILNGVIAEYDASGNFLRRVLQPPAGETLGPQPFSTGTPLGLALDDDGTLYYADLGLVIDGGRIGPGPRTGSTRRIRFVDGQPQAPETLASGLSFPDGVGLYRP